MRKISLIIAAMAAVMAGTACAGEQNVIETKWEINGKFDALGWEAKGDWAIVDFGTVKPNLANNPGPLVKFPAKGKTVGTLTRKFEAVNNPASLTLTFDAGYGWGAKEHSQAIQVMLLDADGKGYIFHIARSKATWGAQWALVTKYGYNDPMTWATAPIDTTQQSVTNGGGLRTFTITRDASGKWALNGIGWSGGPLTFTDTTTNSFSQLVLRGTPNSDDIVFGKIKLDVDAGK